MFGLFSLGVSGVEITRLGDTIPDWLERLCADVLVDFFEQQLSKKNFRILFSKISTDNPHLDIHNSSILPE